MASVLTPNGIVTQTRQEIADEILDGIEGSLGMQVDREPETLLGNIANQFGEREAEIQEVHRDILGALDVNTAEGSALDVILALRTLSPRGQGTASVIQGVIGGVENTVIPSGTRFRFVSNQTEWATTSELTIGAGQTSVAAALTADQIGPVEAYVGGTTAWELLDTVPGVNTYQSTEDATLGQLEESDSAVRQRIKNAPAKSAFTSLTSMESAIADLAGNVSAKATENTTDNPLSGIPAGNFLMAVEGVDTPANRQAIADEIASRLAPGGRPFGTIEVTSTIRTSPVPIRFDFVSSVALYAQITMTTSTSENEDAFLPSFLDEAKSILVDFGNKSSSDIGQDALSYRMEGALSARDFPGVDNISVILSLTSDFSGNLRKIDISPTEKATWALGRVVTVRN